MPVVVYLPVVGEPQVWEGTDAHGLHPVGVADDGQPVEAEAAVLQVVDVLQTEAVCQGW